MAILTPDITKKSMDKGLSSKRPEDIMETFFQKKSINEDLQALWFMLLKMKNNFKRWLGETLEKNKIDDDSYRYFIKIFDFVNTYNLDDLTKLVDEYKELRTRSESKLVHFNKIKREQIRFLKQTFEYLLSDLKGLKEEIKNDALVFIRKNAFRKPESSAIDEKHVKEMNLFLHGLPSRLNSIDAFLNKIDILWSKQTKDKLEEYKKIEISL